MWNSIFLFIFLKTLNETIEEPQKGFANIVDVVNCGSMIGNNNFNSFFITHTIRHNIT